MPIVDIASCLCFAMIIFALYMKVNKSSISDRKGDLHIYAKRGSSKQLDSYCGDNNEIILDTDSWKLRIFDGKTGGRIITGEELYNTYKKSNKMFFLRDDHKYRFGGNSGYKFYTITSDVNNKYTGRIGEIVDVIDKKVLVVHDGKTVGGYVL